MYKLTVISGPIRGTSFVISEGETVVGRLSSCEIELSSSKVSKRHCVIKVINKDIILRDEGSANGTFVNGVLTKSRKINIGDRIGIGDYVLELTDPVAASREVPVAFADMSRVMPDSERPKVGDTSEALISDSLAEASSVPTDIKGKIRWAFNTYIMPFFYGLNFQHEWKVLSLILLGVFAIFTMFFSVFPLIEANKNTIIKETGKRAAFMARSIVERNTQAMLARAETKTEVGNIPKEEGVRLAVLSDLENRIIAPSNKMNQYLASGGESRLAKKAAKLFLKGRETGLVSKVDSETIMAVEPLKVFNSRVGKNIVVAMAVVSIDTTLATPDLGSIGVVYSEAIIITILVGLFVFFVLYFLTLKPFQVLNDDIDKVLKGELSQVTREFKFEELKSLWDNINSALQRIPKGGADGSEHADIEFGVKGVSAEEFVAPVRLVGDALPSIGIVACNSEKQIVYINSFFQELSGIRTDDALGKEFASVARDQALSALVNDVFENIQVGSDPIDEKFEFSGTTYLIKVGAFGSFGSTPRAYVFVATKGDDNS